MRTPHLDPSDKRPATTTGPGALSPQFLADVEGVVNRVKILKLRSKLEENRREGVALMALLDSDRLDVRQKRSVFRKWDAIMREGEVIELTLELIRRHQREQRERAFTEPWA